MGYARSPTHIFPSVSVGAQLDVVYVFVFVCACVHACVCMCVCVCVGMSALVPCIAMSVGALEMQCIVLLKSWVTVHPTMEE